MKYNYRHFLKIITLLITSTSIVYSHEIKIDDINTGYNDFNFSQNVDNNIIYGPLSLDLSNFYFDRNIFIILARTSFDKIVYLAIDCKNSLLNVSNSSLNWKEWKEPIKQFEIHLLDDLCELQSN